MGEEKVNIQELAQKVDELLNVLKVVSGDLAEVSKSLKDATRKVKGQTGITKQTVVAPVVPASSSGKKSSVNEIKQAFSPELVGMLLFEESGKLVIVKPRRFLGSENFAKIASIVRELGGEYISAGRNSHFEIAKK